MINITDSPKNVDLELIKEKKLKYGLYDFTYSLVDIQRVYPSNIYKIGKKRIHWVDFWNEEKEKFEKLKNQIINTIDGHLRRTGFWSPKAKWTNKSKIDYIKGKYEIESFFKVLDKKINEFKNATKKPRKKGKPLQLKSKIAFLWSFVLRGDRGVDWATIASLIDWLVFNLGDSALGKNLKGKSEFTNSSYLKRQIIALKNSEDEYEKILKKLRISYFPKDGQKPVYLINFKKEGFSLHNIEYLIKDIEYYNKYKKFKVNSIKENKDLKINLIDYYKKNRAVPLIIFPNGRTFP